MQSTLCAVQCHSLNVNISDVTMLSLQRLVDSGYVTRKQHRADAVVRLDVTRLGKAVYKGKCREIYFFLNCVQLIWSIL